MGAGGDPFAAQMAEIVRREARALAAVARGEGVTGEDALDAVQQAFETFLLLPDARDLIEGGGARGMLIAITRNAARNLRRRHHNARPHVAVEEVELPGEVPGVDELLARAEDRQAVMTCMRRLADVQRRVVTLRLLEELSGAEVAAMLELTPGHVAVLLHRAKRELLRCIEDVMSDGVDTSPDREVKSRCPSV